MQVRAILITETKMIERSRTIATKAVTNAHVVANAIAHVIECRRGHQEPHISIALKTLAGVGPDPVHQYVLPGNQDAAEASLLDAELRVRGLAVHNEIGGAIAGANGIILTTGPAGLQY